MKLLFLTSSLPPAGGAERIAWDNAIQAKIKHDVHIIAFGEKDEEICVDGIRLRVFKRRSHNFWYYLFFGKYKLLRALKEIRPDVIHSHMYTILTYLLRNYPCKKVLTLHNSEYKYYSLGIIDRLKRNYFLGSTIKSVDKVTTVSSHMRIYFEKLFRREIVLVENGYNENEYFIDNKVVRNQKLVLYVGRLVSFKGVPALLKVAERMPDYEFVFIGGGSLQESSNLENVRFLGVQESDTIRHYYNMAKFSVFLSEYENFPLVGLESMACGAIVIASNINGFREYIQDGINGYLIKPVSPESVIALISGTNNEDKIKEIRINALNTVKSFTSMAMFNKYDSIYFG